MESKTSPPSELNEREREILARLSRGLSNKQIADELFLSLSTIKWYNHQIFSKLRVRSRTQAILRARNSGFLESPAPVAPRPKLPTETASFVGREREIDQLTGLLRLHRLVTLTGTGGTGKTRLALRVAAAVGGEFADGVFFVDLAPLSDHSLVAKAVARALGIQENPGEPLPDTLVRVLAQRELLLLVDNFEHVIAAAPLVSHLLASSPRLKVLATSRESLRLSGEQEFPVSPLSLPDISGASVQQVLQSEAGALFVQRARMVHPTFTVDHGSALAIAAICVRLNGLPLALELAAARCKLLTPQRLLERLRSAKDTSLQALAGGARDAPPRLRTMRNSIEWSYNLLTHDEKTLFERLSVFRGGRSLEAIEGVCGEGLPSGLFDVLASLVDKSLVQQKEAPGGEPRFVMAELIHEYARELLEASGEAGDVRRRHAQYFVAMAERAEPELRRAGYDYWCGRFELEMDNLRGVLEWTLGEGDVTLGIRLAGALTLFWYGKGHHVEGIRWTQALLARLEEAPAAYQPRFLFNAGHLAALYDLDLAQALFTRARDLARELGDPLQVAWSTSFLGYALLRRPEEGLPLAVEGLAMFRALGHKPGVAQTLNIIGEIARLNGDDERARRAYEECLVVSQETGEVRRVGFVYNNLAFIAQHEGDYESAIALSRQVLLLTTRREDRHEIAKALLGFVAPFAALGQSERAARLLGTAEATMERLGAFQQPGDTPEYDRMRDAVRAQLDDDSFQAAWEAGRQTSLEQAVADILSAAR